MREHSLGKGVKHIFGNDDGKPCWPGDRGATKICLTPFVLCWVRREMPLKLQFPGAYPTAGLGTPGLTDLPGFDRVKPGQRRGWWRELIDRSGVRGGDGVGFDEFALVESWKPAASCVPNGTKLSRITVHFMELHFECGPRRSHVGELLLLAFDHAGFQSAGA